MKGLLAPNLTNGIELLTALPLSKPEAKEREFDARFGLHRINVPSDQGGLLTVSLGMPASYPDPELVVNDPTGTSHHPREGTLPPVVYIDIPEGGRKNPYVAIVRAPGGRYTIKATYSQSAFARDHNGDPLIPWNFWFFPFGGDDREMTAWGSTRLRPLQKYERAFKARGVRAWEEAHHADPEGVRDEWEGHCHNIAPASVLFEAPPDEGITYNGVHFEAEELKLLAGEFFGRHRPLGLVWGLPDKNDEQRDEDSNKPLRPEYINKGFLHQNKPSDDPATFGAHLAPDFEDDEKLGLFEHLRRQMSSDGQPVIMDLRDDSGKKDRAVWNHAVYRYSTWYWQEDPHDPDLVEGRTTLYANADTFSQDGSSTGLPAAVQEAQGTKYPVPNDTTVIRYLEYRLRFDAHGSIDRISTEHRWWKATNDKGTLLHAPRRMFIISGPVLRFEEYSDDNPLVESEHVLKLFTVRPRFQT